jgi:uncharacterized protein (TIGR02271 family)
MPPQRHFGRVHESGDGFTAYVMKHQPFCGRGRGREAVSLPPALASTGEWFFPGPAQMPVHSAPCGWERLLPSQVNLLGGSQLMDDGPNEGDVIPLVEERIEVSKRKVEGGRLIVRTHVDVREDMATIDLRQEEVDVERVSVDRVVEVSPGVREEDGVLIVPILEERLVVTKQLVLKEELRIRTRTHIREFQQPVTLRSERAEIERLQGRVSTVSDTEQRSTVDDGPDFDCTL